MEAREQVRLEIKHRAAEAAVKAGRMMAWGEELPTTEAAGARRRLADYYTELSAEWYRVLEMVGDADSTILERARCVRCDHDPEDHRGVVGCAVAWPMPDGLCPCTLSFAEATDPGWAQWIDPDDGSTPIGFLRVRVQGTTELEPEDGS